MQIQKLLGKKMGLLGEEAGETEMDPKVKETGKMGRPPQVRNRHYRAQGLPD